MLTCVNITSLVYIDNFLFTIAMFMKTGNRRHSKFSVINLSIQYFLDEGSGNHMFEAVYQHIEEKKTDFAS